MTYGELVPGDLLINDALGTIIVIAIDTTTVLFGNDTSAHIKLSFLSTYKSMFNVHMPSMQHCTSFVRSTTIQPSLSKKR